MKYHPPMEPGSIAVLDCGGQYAHLLARRVRDCGAFSAILPPETPAKDLRGAAGIILSGGPQSVYDLGSPQADHAILELGVPILGICYGHQWLARVLGGDVRRGTVREYGSTSLTTSGRVALFQGLPERLVVWMSHGDAVTKVPEGFTITASSDACAVAAMADERQRMYGVQFHPEVMHTEYGQRILQNFVDLCAHAPWSPTHFIGEIEERVRQEVGDRNVLMLVSGGVDSTVAFDLLNRVLGPERVYGLLVDTGLMRDGEIAAVRKSLGRLGYGNLYVEDASKDFFAALEGICDPEEKRQIIGDIFLAVQRSVSEHMGFLVEQRATWLLGQGTIYPDTIETGGTKHADKIKTHHNRVGEIQKMIDEGRVVEPLKDLYKDEVRELGEILGLPREIVGRHPFPGPGLGVRILCVANGAHRKFQIPSSKFQTNSKLHIPKSHTVLPLCSVGVQGDARTYRRALVLFSPTRCPSEEHWRLAVEIPNTCLDFNRVLLCTSHREPMLFVVMLGGITRARADLLREADALVEEEIRRAGLYGSIWQFPVVLLPVGARAGGQSIVLRPVASMEAMTAEAFRLPPTFLRTVTGRLQELSGIDMVFYDLTSKPPATIEWE